MEDLHEGTLNCSSTIIQMTLYDSIKPTHKHKNEKRICWQTLKHSLPVNWVTGPSHFWSWSYLCHQSDVCNLICWSIWYNKSLFLDTGMTNPGKGSKDSQQNVIYLNKNVALENIQYIINLIFFIFCWPCIIMYHNNVTNLIPFHYHKHFIVS
jgi:hypothetical protein